MNGISDFGALVLCRLPGRSDCFHCRTRTLGDFRFLLAPPDYLLVNPQHTMVEEVYDWRRRNCRINQTGTDTRILVILSRLQTRFEHCEDDAGLRVRYTCRSDSVECCKSSLDYNTLLY